MNRATELAQGEIKSLLFKFSLPAVLGTMVNATYNIVDRIFIGQAVGEIGIAAATVSMPIMLILMAFGMLIGYGTNSLISIQLGKGNRDRAEQLVGQAIVISLVFWLIFVLIGFLFLDKILVFIGATEDILPHALEYARIIVFGSIVQHISFGVNSFIRGEGNPKIAMTTMFIGAIGNVILDPIFLFGLKMGVKGAAYATIIAQSIAALWVLNHFIRSEKSVLKLRWSTLKVDWTWARKAIAVGTPMCVMHSLGSVVHSLVNNQISSYGGDQVVNAMSAMGIILSVTTIFFMPIIGISQGMQPIIGFNYGAEKMGRVRDTLLIGVKIASAICIVGFLMGQFAPEFLFSLFVGRESEVMEVGVPMFRLAMLAFPIVGSVMIIGSYFQSTGRPRQSMIMTLCRQVIFLIPAVLLLPYFFGIEGVVLCWPISDFMGFIVMLFLFIPELRRLNESE